LLELGADENQYHKTIEQRAEQERKERERREEQERIERERKAEQEKQERKRKEEQERIKRKEQKRLEIRDNAIRFGRPLAMIIQIVASISFVLFWAKATSDSIWFAFLPVGIGALFFCRIFFTDKGKGIISMILIILLSGYLIYAYFFYDEDHSSFIVPAFFIYTIGIDVAAILACTCKED